MSLPPIKIEPGGEWHNTEDRGRGRQQDWAQTCAPRFQQGFIHRHSLFLASPREVKEDDGVLDHDPGQGDDPDARHNNDERRPRDKDPHDNPDE